MSIFSPIEDIIFFVGILIRLIIFEQISGIKLNNISKLTISLLLTVIQILFFNVYLLIEPISLLVVIQFFKTKWNKTQKLFYGLLPIVIGDMFQRIISLYL
ncbi:TPA: histidine kinase, partial [Streptococcus suis]